MNHIAGPICTGLECTVLGLFIMAPLVGTILLLVLGLICLAVSVAFLKKQKKTQPDMLPIVPVFFFVVGAGAVGWSLYRLGYQIPLYQTLWQ